MHVYNVLFVLNKQCENLDVKEYPQILRNNIQNYREFILLTMLFKKKKNFFEHGFPCKFAPLPPTDNKFYRRTKKGVISSWIMQSGMTLNERYCVELRTVNSQYLRERSAVFVYRKYLHDNSTCIFFMNSLTNSCCIWQAKSVINHLIQIKIKLKVKLCT